MYIKRVILLTLAVFFVSFAHETQVSDGKDLTMTIWDKRTPMGWCQLHPELCKVEEDSIVTAGNWWWDERRNLG